jgi:hypothetical protein
MRSTRTRIARLGDIDLMTVLTVCKERLLTLLAFVVVFFALGVVALWFMAPVYRASLQVSPVQSSGTDISSRLGGLSSLASMAGVNLPQSQGGDLYRLYLAGIYSRSTADELAKRTDIMTRLYASEWDAASRSWHEPEPGLVGNAIWLTKTVLGLRIYPWQAPDGARLHDYITRRVALDQDPKKPVATITFNNADPQFAVTFVGALHRAVDDQLRERSIIRSQQYIKYLSDRLPAVTNSEHREALADILSNQEKMLMMTSAAGAYAAEPFGPPSVGDRPISPVSSRVLMAFMAAGAGLGVLFVLLQALGWIGPVWLRSRGVHGVPQAGE